MNDTPTTLRQIAGDYLSGTAPLEALDEAVANAGDAGDRDPQLEADWGAFELLLAERSSGALSADEFRAELRTALTISSSRAYQLATVPRVSESHATVRIHRIAFRITQWLREARVSGTRVETAPESPVAHPA